MLLFKTLTDSDIYCGLVPGVISVLIVVAGYLIQYCQFRKQFSEQQKSANIQIKTQSDISKAELGLSIKQTLLNVAISKSKDCNEIFSKDLAGFGNPDFQNCDGEFYNNTVSELVISSEQINNAFRFFKNDNWKISQEEEMALKCFVIYAFWKQLNTGVRGLFCNYIVIRAINAYNAKIDIRTYATQIISIYDFCSQIGDDMENRPEKEYLELKKLLA